jgi:hypothetical protein
MKIASTLRKGSHTLESVIGSVKKGVSTRRQLANFSSHHVYISCVEPQMVFEALEDPDWVEAMHIELNNFERNKVWSLVEKPKDCRNVIGTKWIFKNKQDVNGIVVRNKARLVAQGYSQTEGIDYGECRGNLEIVAMGRLIGGARRWRRGARLGIMPTETPWFTQVQGPPGWR